MALPSRLALTGVIIASIQLFESNHSGLPWCLRRSFVTQSRLLHSFHIFIISHSISEKLHEKALPHYSIMTASQRAVSPLSDVDSARHSTSDERSEADELEKMRSDEDIDGTFAPIQAPPADEERMEKLHSSSSRPIERSWSLNDGYSCHTVDEEAARNALCNDGGEADESSTFVVSWDENDPMNPRNFNTMRRWLIVIICSLGSLCV